MIATIDIGNSQQSYCLWQDDELHSQGKLSELDLSQCEKIFYISVDPLKTPAVLLNSAHSIDLNTLRKDNTFLGMPIHYSETLGIDRLVLGFAQYKKREFGTLVDAGTFTTIDRITENGFEGGFIALGVEIQKNAYSRGAQLNHEINLESVENTPHSTSVAMSSAIILSQVALIKHAHSLWSSDKIYLTGGAAHLLSEQLHTSVTANLLHQAIRLAGSLL